MVYNWIMSQSLETATFGGGCFWCTEAIFKRLRGVEEVASGYSGGKADNPSYEQVSTGTTGHAEVVQIKFDPAVISFEKLVEIFFNLHDPTTLNKQGADEGTQYRSVIFYHSDNQRKEAERVKDRIAASGLYASPIVTEIVPYSAFYSAEEYHLNYYENNKGQGYCAYVISPKIHKLLKKYSKDVKEKYLSED